MNIKYRSGRGYVHILADSIVCLTRCGTFLYPPEAKKTWDDATCPKCLKRAGKEKA